jgi:hypothetical protein
MISHFVEFSHLYSEQFAEFAHLLWTIAMISHFAAFTHLWWKIDLTICSPMVNNKSNVPTLCRICSPVNSSSDLTHYRSWPPIVNNCNQTLQICPPIVNNCNQTLQICPPIVNNCNQTLQICPPLLNNCNDLTLWRICSLITEW